jgi:hypothetical protein
LAKKLWFEEIDPPHKDYAFRINIHNLIPERVVEKVCKVFLGDFFALDCKIWPANFTEEESITGE